MKTKIEGEFALHEWLEAATDNQLDARAVGWCPPICWHSDRGVFEAWILWPDRAWERVFLPEVDSLPALVVSRVISGISSKN
jgi:hypothetical protein